MPFLEFNIVFQICYLTFLITGVFEWYIPQALGGQGWAYSYGWSYGLLVMVKIYPFIYDH